MFQATEYLVFYVTLIQYLLRKSYREQRPPTKLDSSSSRGLYKAVKIKTTLRRFEILAHFIGNNTIFL